MELVKTEISHDQRKKIYALAKDLKISNDQLHDLMPAWAGTASLGKANCTIAQANKIIEALKAMKNSGGSKVRKPGDATVNQIKAIKAICGDLGWNDAQMNGFIKHTAGKSDIENLKVGEASKVITGLKKLSKTPVKSR